MIKFFQLNGIKENIVIFLLAVLTLMFSYVIGLLVYPYVPLRIDSLTFDKKEAKQGDVVCFVVKGEKFMPIPVRVSVELVNGGVYEVMKYGSNHPPGDKFPDRCFDIPYSIKPKDYHLRWTGTYPVNPIRDVSVTKTSDCVVKVLDGKDQFRGPQGMPGHEGQRGLKGDKGDKGGVSLFGQGPKGPKGDKGDPGR
jgi:hypothetical protein